MNYFIPSALVVAVAMTTELNANTLKPDEKIQYSKPAEGKALHLHVFKPEKTAKSRPCVVFFFGGGWVGGSPSQFYAHANELKKHGVLAISAEYRTKKSHKTTPQDAVRDAKAAIQWVRGNAEKLGVDPNKIVASGGSAGGHLAACAGVIKGFDEGDVSSVPNAMVLFNPVIDTTAKGYGAKKVGDKPEHLSPCHHVRKGLPPTILFHGTKDKVVPFENVERFTRLMKEAGNTCELVAYPGKRHGFFNSKVSQKKQVNKDYESTMVKTIEFLKKQGILK